MIDSTQYFPHLLLQADKIPSDYTRAEFIDAVHRPIVEYTRGDGQWAVVGGYRWRQSPFYVFGDYNGKIMVARESLRKQWDFIRFEGGAHVRGFGKDAMGQIYVFVSEEQGPRASGAMPEDLIIRIDLTDNK